MHKSSCQTLYSALSTSIETTMASQVPAWKKLGLKVKEDLQEDPLALTTHLDNAHVTNKQAKKLNKQKRKAEESAPGNKKPPKRVKLPKSERAPPPEKDQLAYLRQYSEDKANWKFSKQKQNWILKNLREVPEKYEAALVDYLEGLQGSSRTRLADDLKKVIATYNEIIEKAEAKVEAELEAKLNGTAKPTEEEKNEQKKPAQIEPQEDVPDLAYAVRCRNLIKVLNDEVVEVKGVEEPNLTTSAVAGDNVDAEESKLLESTESAETEPTQKVYDNLIIDEVEVGGLAEGETSKIVPENGTEKKKSKKNKSKKSKKSKD